MNKPTITFPLLLLFAVALLSCPCAKGATTITGGILAASDTTGTNARPQAVTISARTNLLAGAITVTNNLNVLNNALVNQNFFVGGLLTNNNLVNSGGRGAVISAADGTISSTGPSTAGYVLTANGPGAVPTFLPNTNASIAANWTAIGTTNSSLRGTFTANSGVVTNVLSIATTNTTAPLNVRQSTSGGLVVQMLGDANSMPFDFRWSNGGAQLDGLTNFLWNFGYNYADTNQVVWREHFESHWDPDGDPRIEWYRLWVPPNSSTSRRPESAQYSDSGTDSIRAFNYHQLALHGPSGTNDSWMTFLPSDSTKSGNVTLRGNITMSTNSGGGSIPFILNKGGSIDVRDHTGVTGGTFRYNSGFKLTATGTTPFDISGFTSYSFDTNVTVTGQLSASNGAMTITSTNETLKGNITANSGTFTNGVTIAAGQSLTITSGALIDSSVKVPSTGFIYWDTRTVFNSPSDGVLKIANNAGNDFGRIQFGGTTTSFPALKRNGTGLSVRLADDSADSLVTSSGVASTGTDTSVAIATGGWTNTFGKNATVYIEGTGVTFTVYNNAGTAVYTNAATVTFATVPLQVSGKVLVTAGTGVSGRAVPF